MNGLFSISVLAAAGLCAAASRADTCCFIGRGATADGSAIVARSVDSGVDEPARCRLRLTPRVEDKAGRRHWGSDGFVWQFPATTWGCISTPRMQRERVGASVGVAANEKGLVVAALTTDAPQPEAREAIDVMSGGATEREYPMVLVQCCTNAQQAAATAVSIVRSRGSGRANIILAADRGGAYVVETHPGHACETMKLPDDVFIDFGAGFTLSGFKPGAAARKYSVKDAFAILRGRNGGPHPSACHVVTVATNQPAGRAVTVWTSLADAAASVFLPVPVCALEFDGAWTNDDDGKAARTTLDGPYACDTFLRLQALAGRGSPHAAGVRGYWEAREDEILAAWGGLAARGSPRALTDFMLREHRRALNDAQRLVGEVEYAMLRGRPFEASDFGQIAIAQMMREGKVRHPVELEKGEADFSGVPKWEPRMEEWKDPTLVPWGKPAAAGRKRALVCVAHADTFAVQHIRNRLDVECDIVEGGYFHEDDPAWLAQLPRLEHALASTNYDGFVFIGVSPAKWPVRLRRRLAELQVAGCGVALVNAGGWGENFREDEKFARGAPHEFEIQVPDARPGAGAFDLVQTNATLPAISVGSFGAGRVVRLALPRTEKDTYMTNPRFSPSWTMTPDRVFQDEYCYAYSCRAVMEALGMRGPATVTEVRFGRIRLAGATNFTGAAAVTIRDTWGKSVWEKTIPVALAAGEADIGFDTPELEVGRYGIDVILRTPAGSCDFAADLFDVRAAGGSPAIVSAALEKNCVEPDEEIRGEVRVVRPAAGCRVRAEVRDPRQRTVVRAEWPVDPATGVARIALSQKRLRLNCHFVYFTLADGGGRVLDRARTWFFRRIKDGERGDFRLYDSAGSHGGKDCAPRLAILDWHGMDLLQGGNRQRLFYGTDAAIRERIPGKLNIWKGSLNSPAWKAWLVKTYTQHAKSLAKCNGRLISLGDDTSECTDFHEGRADWVPHLFSAIGRRIAAELERRRAAGERVSLNKLMGEWLKAHGFDPKMAGSELYWGFQNPIETKIGLKNFLAALKEEDVPLVREAVKTGYDDIRVFNCANRVNARDFDSIDLDTVRRLDPIAKPEFPYFLKWLEKRYGTVGKLNESWGARISGIWTLDDRTLDRLIGGGACVARIDKSKFLDLTFDMNCKLIGEAIRAVDPNIVAGFGASWCGHELQQQFDWLGMCAPYPNCCVHWMNRRLMGPNRYIGECIGWYGWPVGWTGAEKVERDRRVKEGWHLLFGGANFCWMWTACYGLNGARTISPSGYGWLFETLGEINRGPAALVNRARRADDGIAVLLSLDAQYLDALPCAGRGNMMGCMWWTGRFGANQLGYEFITPRDLRRGELVRRGTKLLVLPEIDTIDPEAAEAVRRFVAHGGTVLANRESGLYDADGHRLAKGAFGDLFTTSPRAKILDKDLKTAERELDGELAKAGIAPQIRVVDAKGALMPGVGVVRFLREGGEYAFAIERGRNEGEKLPIQAYVELPAPGAVYDVRAGRRVGTGAVRRFPVELKGLDAYLFTWQPYAVRGISVEFDGKPVRGGTLHLRSKLAVTPCGDGVKAPAVRVFRVEFVPPGGFRRTEFAPIPRYLADAPGGELALDVPLAWDERGDLTVEVTDVATGVSARKALTNL